MIIQNVCPPSAIILKLRLGYLVTEIHPIGKQLLSTHQSRHNTSCTVMAGISH